MFRLILSGVENCFVVKSCKSDDDAERLNFTLLSLDDDNENEEEDDDENEDVDEDESEVASFSLLEMDKLCAYALCNWLRISGSDVVIGRYWCCDICFCTRH